MTKAQLIRQRIAQTARRVAHIKKVLPALINLNKRRRAQLAPKPSAKGRLTVFGIDYAWGSPNPATLHNAGVRFVMRYLSHDATKNLRMSELRSLHALKIKVGVVWESTANRALGGYAAGHADALTARDQAASLGLDHLPIYFACDWDVTDGQKPIVAAYLKGAAAVLGHKRVGVYGGYWVVKYCAERDVCHWFWQTYAWSGGFIHGVKIALSRPAVGRVAHPQTHIYQYSNGHRFDGVSCDYNKATDAAAGYGAG